MALARLVLLLLLPKKTNSSRTLAFTLLIDWQQHKSKSRNMGEKSILQFKKEKYNETKAITRKEIMEQFDYEFQW